MPRYIPMVLTESEARSLRIVLDLVLVKADREQQLQVMQTSNNVRALQGVRRKLESELQPIDKKGG